MKYIILMFVLSVLLPMVFGLFRNPTRRVIPVIEYAQKKGYRLLNPAASQIPGSYVLDMFKIPAFRNLMDVLSDLADIDRLDHATGRVFALTRYLRVIHL